MEAMSQPPRDELSEVTAFIASQAALTSPTAVAALHRRHIALHERFATNRCTARDADFWLEDTQLAESAEHEAKDFVSCAFLAVRGAFCDVAEEFEKIGPSTVRSAKRGAIAHVWRSSREACRFHEALRRIAQAVFECALPTAIHVPLAAEVVHQGAKVTVVWLPAFADIEAPCSSESLLNTSVALLAAAARGTPSVAPVPVFHDADRIRVYALPSNSVFVELAADAAVPPRLQLISVADRCPFQPSNDGVHLDATVVREGVERFITVMEDLFGCGDILSASDALATPLVAREMHVAGLNVRHAGLVTRALQERAAAEGAGGKESLTRSILTLMRGFMVCRALKQVARASIAAASVPDYAPPEVAVLERCQAADRVVAQYQANPTEFIAVTLRPVLDEKFGGGQEGCGSDLRFDAPDIAGLHAAIVKVVAVSLGATLGAKRGIHALETCTIAVTRRECPVALRPFIATRKETALPRAMLSLRSHSTAAGPFHGLLAAAGDATGSQPAASQLPFTVASGITAGQWCLAAPSLACAYGLRDHFLQLLIATTADDLQYFSRRCTEASTLMAAVCRDCPEAGLTALAWAARAALTNLQWSRRATDEQAVTPVDVADEAEAVAVWLSTSADIPERATNAATAMSAALPLLFRREEWSAGPIAATYLELLQTFCRRLLLVTPAAQADLLLCHSSAAVVVDQLVRTVPAATGGPEMYQHGRVVSSIAQSITTVVRHPYPSRQSTARWLVDDILVTVAACTLDELSVGTTTVHASVAWQEAWGGFFEGCGGAFANALDTCDGAAAGQGDLLRYVTAALGLVIARWGALARTLPWRVTADAVGATQLLWRSFARAWDEALGYGASASRLIVDKLRLGELARVDEVATLCALAGGIATSHLLRSLLHGSTQPQAAVPCPKLDVLAAVSLRCGRRWRQYRNRRAAFSALLEALRRYGIEWQWRRQTLYSITPRLEEMGRRLVQFQELVSAHAVVHCLLVCQEASMRTVMTVAHEAGLRSVVHYDEMSLFQALATEHAAGLNRLELAAIANQTSTELYQREAATRNHLVGLEASEWAAHNCYYDHASTRITELHGWQLEMASSTVWFIESAKREDFDATCRHALGFCEHNLRGVIVGDAFVSAASLQKELTFAAEALKLCGVAEAAQRSGIETEESLGRLSILDHFIDHAQRIDEQGRGRGRHDEAGLLTAEDSRFLMPQATSSGGSMNSTDSSFCKPPSRPTTAEGPSRSPDVKPATAAPVRDEDKPPPQIQVTVHDVAQTSAQSTATPGRAPVRLRPEEQPARRAPPYMSTLSNEYITIGYDDHPSAGPLRRALDLLQVKEQLGRASLETDDKLHRALIARTEAAAVSSIAMAVRELQLMREETAYAREQRERADRADKGLSHATTDKSTSGAAHSTAASGKKSKHDEEAPSTFFLTAEEHDESPRRRSEARDARPEKNAAPQTQQPLPVENSTTTTRVAPPLPSPLFATPTAAKKKPSVQAVDDPVLALAEEIRTLWVATRRVSEHPRTLEPLPSSNRGVTVTPEPSPRPAASPAQRSHSVMARGGQLLPLPILRRSEIRPLGTDREAQAREIESLWKSTTASKAGSKKAKPQRGTLEPIPGRSNTIKRAAH